MKVCIVGGIFGRSEEYRQKHKYTPESILAEGLRDRGVFVETVPHHAFRPSDGYDVVHVHHLSWGAVRAAMTRGKAPFVFTVHGPYFANGTFKMLERPISSKIAFRYVLARCDAVVALSYNEAGILRRINRSLPNIRVIPNGIPADIYRPAAAPHNGEQRSARILYVGSLAPFKGVALLLRATREISRRRAVELTLVYQYDRMEKKYRSLAKRLGISDRVHFTGFLSGDDVALEYRKADVTVLPSRSEALPSVITESLLSGTPVVASDVGGIAEQVNRFGIVVPAGNLARLTDAIDRILADAAKYRERRDEMRNYAMHRFSISTMIDAHLELYEDLIGEKRGSRKSGRILDGLVSSAIDVYQRTSSHRPA